MRFISAVVICLAVVACNRPPAEASHTYLRVTLALVPGDVAEVTATITAPDLSSPIVASLTISGNSASGVISDVPAGSDRTVTVQGYAASLENTIVIYQGRAVTSVLTGEENSVSVTLEPVNGNVAVSATFPSGDVDVSIINHTSVVISGARVNANLTYYLALNAAAGTAAGVAASVPVGVSRTFLVQSYSASGALLFSGSATAAVVQGTNAVAVSMTNGTGQGSVSVNGSFCQPNCTGLVCGSDGCDGSCGGCEPGSPCSEGVCQTALCGGQSLLTVAMGQQSPAGIGVDPQNVYWADDNSPNGTVLSAPVCGGTVQTLISGLNLAGDVASDSANVYVEEVGAGAILQVPLNGATPITLATGQAKPYGITVDANNVYWTNGVSGGTVMQARIGGGTLVTVANGQASPTNVAASGNNVYWTNWSAGAIVGAPVGGGTLVTLASGSTHPYGIAADSNNVYWTDDYGAYQVPAVSGSTTVTLFFDASINSTGSGFIVVDQTTAYWTAPGLGSVMMAPIGGGAVSTLVSGLASPTNLAIDAEAVYWTEFGSGVVLRAVKP